MTPAKRPALTRTINAAAALICATALLTALAVGAGPLPALGRVLDPGRGVWTSAAGGLLPTTRTLHLPGIKGTARVTFSRQGIAAITASSDWDAYLALGYVQASFRLTEMDLSRRLGEGRLAQLAGPAAIRSDRFELQLGLLRTARAEWASTPRSSPAGQALLGYARGVNDWIEHVRSTGQWPALFTLAGVYPRAWTPVDSLAIQGSLTQELSFTTSPLDDALLARSLGAARLRQWFPVLPPVPQHPYDPGPYPHQPVAAAQAQPSVSKATAAAAAQVLRTVSGLPGTEIHRNPDSNAWAANGPTVAGGVAMLAGDPHLPTTLPSVWYETSLRTPDLDVSGVSVAGLPAVLLGHNRHIAWSLTDVQNQSAIFYRERTSPQHPGHYFWRGHWRRMRQLHYAIRVRGAPPAHLTVELTVHGPVLTTDGQTVSVDWTGNLPSPDLAAIIGVGKAANFAQFKRALAGWHAPTQNFVYADDRGNIGAIAAGYYPVVAHGDPSLPLPGDGSDDVTGTIPYSAVPQVYDPPGHLIASANQRPVGPGYPYYLGTTADFFDPGYRADELYAQLGGRRAMTAADFAATQHNVTDDLAAQVVPQLLAALRGTLPPAVRAARTVLADWNDEMSANSAAASLWWAFWGHYLSAVFGPWWRAEHVPVHLDGGLRIGQLPSLGLDLASWTVGDQGNPAFSPPGQPGRSAREVMRDAFEMAVRSLAGRLGGRPADWTWGRLHSRVYPSLTQSAGLGYGPRPDGGDPWTIDAADGSLTSAAGPSWRMVIAWTGPAAVRAQGTYPGGQSDNPASPWYQDLFPDWWRGYYLPFPGTSAGARTAGTRPASEATWTMEPQR